MISNINGFSANLNFSFKDNQPKALQKDGNPENLNNQINHNTNLKIDYDKVNPDDLSPSELENWANAVDPKKLSKKHLNKLLAVKMGFTKPQKELSVFYSKENMQKAFALSGYTTEGKISIWGKLSGFDQSMSKEEVENLKKFVNSTKVLGIDMFRNYENDAVSVDALNNNIIGKESKGSFGLGIVKNLGGLLEDESLQILDSDMNIEEFKSRWLDYAIRKRAEIEINGGISEIKDMRPDKERIYLAKKDGDLITYIMETKKHKYTLNIAISSSDSLEKISKTLESIKELIQKEEKSEFKPIKATNKSKTYKDEINREFFLKFLKAEQEKGNDITKILEELRKISKLDMKI
ncbi:hypothetical protein [Campylobacter sp. RM15925]|uniref:hypothetical protein n=1 Tax=Campylobacter sp. RM15925 TaxID=1705724 RepID=UPI001473D7DC|nr:hypothetical protein [Campylobacter sp. RM15925]